MRADQLNTMMPTRRLRGALYATVLLVGGGLIGAITVGPTLGQGFGGGQRSDDAEGDAPRWHQSMDRRMEHQGDQDEGPGWHRFMNRQMEDEDDQDEGHRGYQRQAERQGDEDDAVGRHHRFMDRQMGRQDDQDERPGWRRFMERHMGRQADEDDGPGWRRGFGWHRFGRRQDDEGSGMGPRMGRGFAGMMYPGAIERRVNRMLALVDASTEQKQKVRAIFEKAANDFFGMREQIRANRRASAEALGAATIDHAKVEQLRTDRMKLTDQASKRWTDALVEAAEVLTPAQRADLLARFQRRGG